MQSGFNRVIVPVIQNPLPIGNGRRSEGSLINFPPRIAGKGKAQPAGHANSEETFVSIGSHFSGNNTGFQAAFAIRRNTYFRRVPAIPNPRHPRQGRKGRERGKAQPLAATPREAQGKDGAAIGEGDGAARVLQAVLQWVRQSIPPFKHPSSRVRPNTSHMVLVTLVTTHTWC